MGFKVKIKVQVRIRVRPGLGQAYSEPQLRLEHHIEHHDPNELRIERLILTSSTLPRLSQQVDPTIRFLKSTPATSRIPSL